MLGGGGDRPTNGILLVCEFSLSSYYTHRWWGHLNLTYCNQICLNFLHSQMMGTLKHCLPVRLCPHAPKSHIVKLSQHLISVFLIRTYYLSSVPFHGKRHQKATECHRFKNTVLSRFEEPLGRNNILWTGVFSIVSIWVAWCAWNIDCYQFK